jgi:hypothetical protein
MMHKCKNSHINTVKSFIFSCPYTTDLIILLSCTICRRKPAAVADTAVAVIFYRMIQELAAAQIL